jgi:hypothetical protein
MYICSVGCGNLLDCIAKYILGQIGSTKSGLFLRSAHPKKLVGDSFTPAKNAGTVSFVEP